MIGETISHYKIIEKLGEGGMGVVYKAQDTQLDRFVALKFLPDRVNTDETAKARFLQEAKAAAGLNHPNICTIHGVEEHDGALFMVMEYVQGGTLGSKIPFAKVDDAITIATQIGDALQEAHAKGIVHRDIKADNIMLSSKGQAKVMDFGLAKLKGALKLTRTSSTVGTLGYMAPEQIQGGEVDPRSDIFAFGVLLFEMLTGKLPFRGEHEAAMIYSIVNEDPQDISQLLPELSPIINNLIQRCLEKDPNDRYQHFDDIVADLRRSQKKTSRIMRSSTVAAAPSSSVRPISNSSQPVVEAALDTGKKSFLQSKGVLIGIAAAVLVVVAGAFYMFTSSSGASETRDKTIAVLPFTNSSGDAKDEFFTEGITEDILAQLSKISELTVLSKFTLRDYNIKDKTPQMIGKELNVSAFLVGSIRRDGDQLRISCQLINTKNGADIWSETYDRTMKDVFSVQKEIARSIATSLQTKLSKSDEQRLANSATTNTDANNAILQGRYFGRLGGRENFEKAVFYFKQALQYDSTYAPAWDFLASVHVSQASIGYIPLQEGYRQARMEVNKALELDPNYADAYATLGSIKANYDWDWTGADAEFKRGLELDPGNVPALGGAASLASTLGRFDESIALQRKVVKVDPLRSSRQYNLSIMYYKANRLTDAYTAVQKAIELSPSAPGYHMMLGSIYLMESKPEDAFNEIQQETEPVWKEYFFPLVYFALGKKKESDAALADFIKKYQNEGAYQIAQIYAYRGEKDKAFQWLERAYRQRDGGLAEMVGEPMLRSIKDDPRYSAFMKKMKLPG